MITFTVYGNAEPKARARTVRLKNGRTVSYTPGKTAAWEDSIKLQALEHRPGKLLDGPLVLEVTFFLQRPQSRPKKCRYPDRKPDLDNLIKSLKDACEGIIYTNDSRIVEEHVKKEYGDPPRVEVKIYRPWQEDS